MNMIEALEANSLAEFEEARQQLVLSVASSELDVLLNHDLSKFKKICIFVYF